MFFRRNRTNPVIETNAPTGAVATLEPPAHHSPPADHREAHLEAPSVAGGDAQTRRRRRSRGRSRGGATGADGAVALRDLGPALPPPLAPVSEAFRVIGVDELGLAAIAALGFTEPTPIQRDALPVLAEGTDVVGQAQTGSGKTIAFAIPLSQRIDPALRETQAIVLVPTRELAKQVHTVIAHLGAFYGYTAIGLIGGSRVQTDVDALNRGAHVVVGTPGRVIDHLERGTLSLGAVRFAVLDEADEMLDIGFQRAVETILRRTPKSRQTALFSATMPESVSRLVYRFMRDPERVAIAPQQRTVESVEQHYCEVAERDKFYALRHVYETHGMGRALIFRRTKIGVDRLTAQLQSVGVPARAIHGDLRQSERDRVMGDFRSGKLEFLIATNVAARGLDIPDISHVINYDVPQNAEEYIHRVGRTARAGKRGSAITLVGEWELDEWDTIRSTVGSDQITALPMPTRWE